MISGAVEKRFNPEMLILARESRAMTQAGLAKAADTTQGRISKIENGVLDPPPALVSDFATALEYRESFFYQSEQIYGLPQSYTRRKQSLGSATQRRIFAEINIKRIQVMRLLKAAQIEERHPLPQLAVEDYHGSAAEVAQAVRASWLLPPGPVRNLTRSLEAAGVLVIPAEFGTREIDAVGQRISGLPPMIFYNPGVPADRLRFTLAHELGHLVMHRVPHPLMEDEANEFAAEFLMPLREIRPQIPSRLTLADLASLKPVWRVAMSALLVRGRDIGKISDGQYRYLWSQMSRNGWRLREPAELDFPAEHPTILRDLIALHLNTLRYNTEELSEVLHIFLPEFRQRYAPERAHLRLVANR